MGCCRRFSKFLANFFLAVGGRLAKVPVTMGFWDFGADEWDVGQFRQSVPQPPARERILGPMSVGHGAREGGCPTANPSTRLMSRVRVGHFGEKSEPGEGEREEPEQAG